MNQAELDNRFAHHPPSPSKVLQHQQLRAAIASAAAAVNEAIPFECREKSLAVTALEEAMFWANAGLARHDQDGQRL